MCQEMEDKCSNSKGEEEFIRKSLTCILSHVYKKKMLPDSQLAERKEMEIVLGEEIRPKF